MFDTIYPQKLPLKVSSSVLHMNKCKLPIECLHSLLHGKKINGSIVDMGKKGSLRLFIYKFENTTRCSNASGDDFTKVIINQEKEREVNPPAELKRNVAWSFFALMQTRS